MTTRLLTVGRLHPEKGLETLLDAMPEVLEEVPDAVLDIAGSGNFEDALRERIKNLNLDGHVNFLGFVEDPLELREHYESADLYVHPALNDNQPFAILDAIKYRVPVVASDIGGIPYLIEDGVSGMLVPQKDPHALAQAIVRGLSDRERLEGMAEAAYQRTIRTHAPQRIAELTFGLYDGIKRGIQDKSTQIQTQRRLNVLYVSHFTDRMNTRWRAEWPSKHLAEYGIDVRIRGALDQEKSKMVSAIKPDIDWADIVIFQKTGDQVAPLFDYVKRSGKLVGYDVDDLMFCDPGKYDEQRRRYTRQHNDAVIRFLQNSDFVTTSTNTLGEHIRPWNQNVHLVKNRMDLEELGDIPLHRHVDKLHASQEEGINGTNQVRILWAGTPYHAHEVLEYFFPIFQDMVQRYGKRVKLVVKTEERLPWVKPIVEKYRANFSGDNFYVYGFTPEAQWKQYYEDLAALQSDIMISALPNTEFNRCKSELKFLESALIGVPLLTTHRNGNGDKILDAYNGMIAASPEEFHAKLRYLIENPIARRRIGQTARWTLEDSYDIHDSAVDLQNILWRESSKRDPAASRDAICLGDYSINWFKDFKPEVSILIRTANRPDLLERAIRSALNQHGENLPSYEVVVVNNGEEVEGTREVIKRIADPRVRYIEKNKRHHIAYAINEAILGSNGNYLTYLDDDDVLRPNHISVLYDALKKEEASNSKVGLVYSDVEYHFYKDGKIVGKDVRIQEDFDRKKLIEDNYIVTSTCMHRKGLYHLAGYSDPNNPNLDDWDRWIRMAHIVDFKRVPVVTKDYTLNIDNRPQDPNGNWLEIHKERALRIAARMREEYGILFQR